MLGRRGRGRGGRDYYPRNAPPGGPGYGRGRGRGGRGEGRGQEARVGYGNGRGGRGGYDGAAPPPHRRASIAARQPLPQQEASSSSTSAAASLIQAMERKLSVRETAEAQASGLATASSPMVAATPGTHDAPQPESSEAMNHPSRPDYGSVGRKVMVRANHFQVRVTNKELCHYDVAITPEATSRSVNRRVISKLVELYGKSHLGNRKPVYDGRKSLYTAGALPFISEDFVIELIEEKGDIKKEKKYTVAIKLAGRADLHHLDQFLSGGRLNASQETLQVLSVVLRESPSTIYTAVARSFFSPMFEFSSEIGDGLKRPTEIGNGLECWRGYYQSLRPTQLGLSLNVDISATYFYKPVLVTQFVKEYLRLGDQPRALSDQDRVKIKKALSGLRVQATHSCRHYKISGISSLPMNELMFSRDEQGTNVSVVQYFQERYDYPLEYVTWPCLQAGSDSGPTYLPMEVCKIEEGQHFSRKLNTEQVSAILKVTCRRPQQREETILQIVEQNNYSNDKYAEEFGIHVSDKLVSVTARVLPPPRLKYHASGRHEVYYPENGQWNMTNKKLVNGGTVKNWTCANFSELGQKEVCRFCDELVRKCCDVGMKFNPKELVDFRFARPDGLESALREVHNLSTETLARNRKGGQHLQLLIVVLPKMSGPYGKIKRLCETELGIVTQCCLPQHVSACKPQYLENVALKINVKVGGRNTVLESALHNRIPLVTDVPTIIFGADVTHPPPGQDSSSSIAAVVASMDWPQVTKYRALVSAQPPRQEMIEDLYTETQDPHTGTVCGGMIRELLIAFQKSTKQEPSRIIFYRDGVSEGQFSQVLQYELAAIRKACVSLLNQRTPVTFVVVQKRHHTRLFPVDVNLHADRSGNIRPGTVVDTEICHPTGFDFYLCSHAGIQGTSRPTHYHVLLDENGFSADRLQMLTNNLCYTYARCTRSVSVVPPAYYAHLAAARARNYVEAEAPEGCSASGGDVNAQQGRAGVRPLPTIKDNVKDVMFYC